MQTRHHSCNSAVTIILASLLILFMPALAIAEMPEACDAAAELKGKFVILRREFVAGESPEDEAAFRAIAYDYVSLAEQCYQETYGSAAEGGSPIDEGGMWMPSSNSSPADTRFVLFSTKWGAGSPFIGGTDVPGPRLPGGTVTYSYMPAGVSYAAESSPPPDTNTPIWGLTTFDACFLEEIEHAFGAWSAIADITFVAVTDGGGAFNAEPVADIRIGAHTFDGPGGLRGHTFFPPPNGNYGAGDMHFDMAETWTCDPASGTTDFGIVALHEIGHAIGLRHESSQIAIMNAPYNAALTFGPLADDIIAAGELYGSGGAATMSFFPNVGIGTDTPTAPLDINIGTLPPGPGNSILRLERFGPLAFQLKDGTDSGFWQFANAAGGSEFRISKSGTSATELKLTPAGDLTITGKIFTSSCSPCVSDYVFEPDYKLMSLDELEAFVKKNRHMPNVPSQGDIDQAGALDMTTMQMRLLEKIEELALYTIEQQKMIKDLELRLEAVEH